MLMSVATIVSSCQKDKYQPKGDYQPAGDYGNGTITYSNTVNLTGWTSDYDDGTNFTFHIDVLWSSITSWVKDNGIVMVYAKSGAEWVALPANFSGSGYSISYNFSFDVGKVTIEASGYDTPSPNTVDFDGTLVRIVVISEAGKLANPNVNYNDYNEVKRIFNLKD